MRHQTYMVEEGGVKPRKDSRSFVNSLSLSVVNTRPRLTKSTAHPTPSSLIGNSGPRLCKTADTLQVPSQRIQPSPQLSESQPDLALITRAHPNKVSQQDPSCRTSDAGTTVKNSSASNAGDRRYEVMTAKEAGARSAWARACAPTSASRASARNAGDGRCASMTAAGASPRSAWARASALTSASRASAMNAGDGRCASMTAAGAKECLGGSICQHSHVRSENKKCRRHAPLLLASLLSAMHHVWPHLLGFASRVLRFRIDFNSSSYTQSIASSPLVHTSERGRGEGRKRQRKR